MTQISVLHTDQLTAQQYAAIVQLCSTVFDTDYQVFLHRFGRAAHVIAEENGVLLSHALWITRWLQPNDLPPLRTAYVEAVATEPAARGRGLASGVLRRLMAEIQAYEIGGLATGIFDFYARLGWERWLGPIAIRTPSGLVPESDPCLMVLRLPQTPPIDTSGPISCEWREGEAW